MASVFLSYAREDAAKAKRLAETLEAAGHSVWSDHHIHAGARFSQQIEAALSEADLVLVLWSRASVDSPWVQDEAAAGRDSDRLVPILLEDVAPPLGFRQYQSIDLTSWTERGTARGLDPVLKAIDRRTTSPAKQSAMQPKPVSARRGIDGRKAFLAALTALVLLVAVGWWATRDHYPDMTVVVAAAPGAPNDARELARSIAVDFGRFRAGPLGSLTVLRHGVKGASDADYQVEIGLSRSSQSLRGDISLMGARRSQILWSTAVEGPADRIVDVRQQMAAQLGSVLSCAVDLRARGTKAAPEVLGLYLSGCAAMTDAVMDKSDGSAFSIFRQITRREPDFAPAWAHLAFIEGHSYLGAPGPERPSIAKSGSRYLERARRLDPSLEEVFAAEALLHPYNKERWKAALAILDRGLEANPESAVLHSARAEELIKRGRMNEAVESARRSVEINPLAPSIRDDYILILAFAGRPHVAARELEELARIWPGSKVLSDTSYRFKLRFGDPAEALRLLNDPSDPNAKFLQAMIERTPANLDAAVEAHMAHYRRDPGHLPGVIQVLGTFDRVDEAYRVLGATANLDAVMAATEVLFRPAMRSFRADPRFMVLTERLGLLDYWRDSGVWPEFCAEPGLPYDCQKTAAELANRPDPS